jgi:hypothetical protein
VPRRLWVRLLVLAGDGFSHMPRGGCQDIRVDGTLLWLGLNLFLLSLRLEVEEGLVWKILLIG